MISRELLRVPDPLRIADSLESGKIKVLSLLAQSSTIAALNANTEAVAFSITSSSFTEAGCTLAGPISSPPELAGKLALLDIDWDKNTATLAID